MQLQPAQGALLHTSATNGPHAGNGGTCSSPGSVPVTHARSRSLSGLGSRYQARRTGEAGAGAAAGMQAGSAAAAALNLDCWDLLLLLLRVVAIAFTLASLLIMLHAKQTVTLSFLAKFDIAKTANYKGVRAFR